MEQQDLLLGGIESETGLQGNGHEPAVKAASWIDLNPGLSLPEIALRSLKLHLLVLPP